MRWIIIIITALSALYVFTTDNSNDSEPVSIRKEGPQAKAYNWDTREYVYEVKEEDWPEGNKPLISKEDSIKARENMDMEIAIDDAMENIVR